MTQGPSPTVLLIATHPQFIYLIERYGERSGCRVMSTDTIEEAVELVGRQHPAMVLLHLTGWPHDGWPLLRDLRSRSVTSTLPITVISAVVDEAQARAEGATYWLWQPVLYDDFLTPLIAAQLLPAIATGEGERTGTQASI